MKRPCSWAAIIKIDPMKPGVPLARPSRFRSKKIKVLLDFFQKIAVSKGRAFGRASQGAKLPPAAAGEIPSRPKRHPQMAQSPRQSRKAAVPTPYRVVDGGLFVRVLPSTWLDVARYGVYDPRRPPRRGGGEGHGHWPEIAPSADGALERLGCFAGCGQREFRALRGATKGSAFGNRDFLKKIE